MPTIFLKISLTKDCNDYNAMFNRGINIYAELNLPHCNIIDMISLLSLVLKEGGGGRGGGLSGTRQQ